MASQLPTGEEIAAFVAGVADQKTTRRILAAVLTDQGVRQRVAALRSSALAVSAAETATATSAELTGAESAALLTAFLQATQEAVASAAPLGEITTTSDAATPSPFGQRVQQAVTAAEQLRGVIGRALLTGRQLLTLPCLAPAAAASAPDLVLRRQIVTTGEGVRIEFQQLPGGPPYKMRIVVDAAALQTDANRAESPVLYDVAYLTLTEETGAGDAGSGVDSPPDKHVLVVSLNERGRGFSDFTVGGRNGASQALPAPRAPLSLLSATLTQREEGWQTGI